MFGVRPDRFDHEVECIGAVDLTASNVTLSMAKFQKLIFAEVIETVVMPEPASVLGPPVHARAVEKKSPASGRFIIALDIQRTEARLRRQRAK